MFLIIFMGIILGVFLIGMTRKVLTNMVQQAYEEKILAITANAAESIDGDKVKKLWDEIWEIYETIPPEEWVSSEEWGSPEFEDFLANFSHLEETEEYKTL